MNAQDVADYLETHPEFFDEHATLFAALTVPHPHGGRAIPLAERQMMTLREKNKVLELKVAELMRFGQENDAIAEKLRRWTRMLLLQRSTRLLPETLTGSLAEIFAVPDVALTVWDAADDYADVAGAAAASPELIAHAATLIVPYCGAPHGDSAAALALFRAHRRLLDDIEPAHDAAPGADHHGDIRSIALIALRRGAAPAAFGLLALGSADAWRFHDGMGTDFLSRIGEISSAALTRLLT